MMDFTLESRDHNCRLLAIQQDHFHFTQTRPSHLFYPFSRVIRFSQEANIRHHAPHISGFERNKIRQRT